MNSNGIRRFLLLMFCSVLLLPVQSAIVDKEMAKLTALSVLKKNSQSRSIDDVSLLWDSEQLLPKSRQSVDPAFYVFAPTSGTGFVIIAAEDTVEPVFAYSFNSSMPSPSNLPDNFRKLMNDYREGILYFRNLSSTGLTQSSSRSLGDEVVMLNTPTWSQRAPYYIQCPLDAGKYSLTGCTATAIAIVMRYYKWPEKGNGETEAYHTKSKSIPVEPRNLELPYAWDKMKMEYINNDFTTEEANAVARLMADIGAAIQANYTNESTSAAVKRDVLKEKFNYHKGMRAIIKNEYSDYDWTNLIKHELDKNRPVLYTADHATSGHAFVLDGYTTSDYFHINWGWGGYCDGFFSLNNITDGENVYKFDHWAYQNFIPEDGSHIEDHLIYRDLGLSTDVTEFEINKGFYITASFSNRTAENFNGYIRPAVTDMQGNLLYWLRDAIPLELDFNYRTSRSLYVTLQSEPELGHRIRLFYQYLGETKWYPMTSLSSDIPWEIPLTDEMSIGESTSIQFDKNTGNLTLKYRPNVVVEIFKDGEPVKNKSVQYNGEFVLHTKETGYGKYIIRLSKSNEIREVTFEFKSF